MINVPTDRHYAGKVAGILLLLLSRSIRLQLINFAFFLEMLLWRWVCFCCNVFHEVFFATQLKNRSRSSLFKSWPATQTMQHALSMTSQNNALWVVAVKNFFSKSGNDYISSNTLQQCKANKNVKSEGLWSPPRFTASRKVDTEYSNLSTASSGSSASDVTGYSLQWSHFSCSDDWSSKVATDIELCWHHSPTERY